jgi:hypothetical protein
MLFVFHFSQHSNDAFKFIKLAASDVVPYMDNRMSVCSIAVLGQNTCTLLAQRNVAGAAEGISVEDTQVICDIFNNPLIEMQTLSSLVSKLERPSCI